jgi:hypothetical protein
MELKDKRLKSNAEPHVNIPVSFFQRELSNLRSTHLPSDLILDTILVKTMLINRNIPLISTLNPQRAR